MCSVFNLIFVFILCFLCLVLLYFDIHLDFGKGCDSKMVLKQWDGNCIAAEHTFALTCFDGTVLSIPSTEIFYFGQDGKVKMWHQVNEKSGMDMFLKKVDEYMKLVTK